MPKRAVTPPPGDDEPRYLTVVHPYPLHANMELPKDREDFGRWLACCIGPDPFYAFFHKPSALNMVIVEIKRDFDGFDRLLGEHKWSEFLCNPSTEEAGKVTRIYYCIFNSGRQVQKNGWKRIDAQGSWFRNWSPKNDLIRFPYPKTSYCDLPLEDQTNYPLCRPLPSKHFTPPPAVAQAVVRPPPPGSAGWVSQKAANKAVPARGTWGRGTPTSLHIPTSTRGSKAPASAKTSSSPNGTSPWLGSPTSSVKGSAPVSANPWRRTASSFAADSATSPTDSQSGVSCASSPSVQTPLSALPVPPGLGSVPITLPVSTSWADDIPPGLFPGLFPDIIVSNAQFTLPPLDSFAHNPVIPNHPDVPDNIEDAFAELEVADPVMGYVSAWEVADNQQVKAPELPSAVSGSLWDDYEEEKPVVQELLCTDHGRICKKGICKTYAKQLKEVERAKKMTDKPKGDWGRGRGRGRGRGGRGSNNNWRGGSQVGSQKNDQTPRPGNLRSNSNSNSSGTSTPLNPSSADDDDRFSVVSSSKSSKRSRSRANSIASAAPSEASGWGNFSQGPW